MELIPGLAWDASGWQYRAALLSAVVAVDALLGDPRGAWHPVVLIGKSLTGIENVLRRLGWDGYGGGILLFAALAILWCLPALLLLGWLQGFSVWAVFGFEALAGGILLAQRSLIEHVWAIERASRADSLDAVRARTAMLVGRDTDPMDRADCRRAGLESLAEGFTDGILSPLFYLALGGLPAMLLFKIVSTMDSMVGYKNARYLRFGWCGARLDDALNYLPARLSFLLFTFWAVVLPGFRGRDAWTVGLRQHAIIPGPNAGWSETAMAGALGLRIAGPIYRNGVLVNEAWLGRPEGRFDCDARDLRNATLLVVASTVLFCAIGLVSAFSF